MIEGLSEKLSNMLDKALSKQIKKKKEDIKSLEDLLALDSEELEDLLKLEIERDEVIYGRQMDRTTKRIEAVRKFHEEFSNVIKWMRRP